MAIVDLFSRKVLSWRLSNSMDPSFCVTALEEAIETYGEPAILNTDQGSQFTSKAFISVLKEHSIEDQHGRKRSRPGQRVGGAVVALSEVRGYLPALVPNNAGSPGGSGTVFPVLQH